MLQERRAQRGLQNARNPLDPRAAGMAESHGAAVFRRD